MFYKCVGWAGGEGAFVNVLFDKIKIALAWYTNN